MGKTIINLDKKDVALKWTAAILRKHKSETFRAGAGAQESDLPLNPRPSAIQTK